MIVAALVFEAGLCRDDPSRILAMPIRELLFWYDLCVGWRKEVAEAREQARQRAEREARFRGRRL